MKKLLLTTTLTMAGLFGAQAAQAADYIIDTKGAHAFIQFKISHLGYSWVLGRFNNFTGKFSYDAASPEASVVDVVIDTASIDSNHAERDKRLRNSDFLDAKQYPEATFKSTGFKFDDAEHAVVTGNLTLRGVTRNISFPIKKIGEGKDLWGGYRAGFEGQVSLKLADYGINFNLGPTASHVEIFLSVEGIRQQSEQQ